MKRVLSALIISAAFCVMAAAQAPAPADSAPKLEKFEPSIVDKSKDPCQDFYQYTCTKWNADHPIPADLGSNGTATPLFLYNQTILRDTLVKAAANKSATGSERQIGDYWQSCMDQSGRNAQGEVWLKNELKVADGLKSKQDLARVLAHLHLSFPGAWQGSDNQTDAALFGYGPTQDFKVSSKVVGGLDQGGLGMPNRDFYLSNDERSTKTREAYVAHVQKMFELAGDPADKAAAEAKTVLAIETELAKAQMDNVKRRDPANLYNTRTYEQVKSATPSFGWDEYFKLINAPKPEFYIVSTPAFMETVEQQLKTRSVDDWRTYLRWWTIHGSANALGEKFVDANFEFYNHTLAGVPKMLPLWRRCVGSEDAALGEALGQAYVNTAFPPEAKAKALELVKDLRTALSKEITELDWMSPETKKQAEAKLQAMEQKIGYPDKWRDYSSVKLTPSNFLENRKATTAFEFHRQLNKIGRPLDRTEWGMTPPTINAYNDGQMNSINFPAGILQLPFFSPDQDAPANYGGIGMIIGHEIIHGFDDQGRKFDLHGNMTDWWTPQDSKNYDERGNCIAEQYTGDTPDLGVKRNGRLTQGEDTADNGGIHLAMLALEEKYKRDGKSLDEVDSTGTTPRQRFYEAQAFGWCRNTRPDSERLQVQTNPHSLARYRVNNPVSNQPEFWKAFNCKKGDAMVHTPACQVW